jgi:tetratricopeptide (TPR) repeat protein
MATAQPNSEGKREGSPGKVSAALAQARQHLIRNNAAAALTVLKDIAALPDCPADVRVEAAKMLATAGANAEAAQCYLNAGLALLYDHGDMARARQAFASAHNLDPQNLDVIFHLGQADVVEGRTQDGLAKFIDVLRKSNLKHTPALFEAGCIYQANGQYDQAILAFKKVLDREKEHIQAIVHMGQLHQIKGMIPEAIGYYMQAAQITREAQQLGTTRQIVNMVLSLDANNARARSILADLDEKPEDEEGETRDQAPQSVAEATESGAPETHVPAPKILPAKAAPAPPPALAKTELPKRAASAAGDEALAQLREDKAVAQAELRAIQAQVDAARRELDAAAARRQELEQAKLARIDELEKQKVAQIETDARQRREHAEAELRALHAQLAQARAQREEEAATRDAIAAAAAELDAKLQQMQAELCAVEAQRAQAANAVARSSRELDQKARDAKALAAREEALLKELQAQAAQAQANLSKASTAQEAAMLEIAARRQRAQAELDALNNDVARTKREKDAQHERAELSVSELEKRAEQLKGAIASAEAKRAKTEAEAAATQQTLETLEQRLAAERAKAETATADLKDIVDEARRAQTHASDMSAKLAELRAQIEQAEGRKRTLEDSIGKVKPLAASAEKRRTEADAAAAQAEKKKEKTEVELKSSETRKRELEESLAKLKSLQAAAEQRRLESEAAAEQAEALRSKREADAEALAARVAGLESSLRNADARTKASAEQSAVLAEVTKKVEQQKAAVAKLESMRQETEEALAAAQAQRAEAEAAVAAADDRRNAAERRIAELETQHEAAQSRREHQEDSRAAATAMRSPMADLDAEAVALVVPPESCVESLRTIETLAADGDLTIDTATEMASLIHEGRAPSALREARKQANLAAQPAPYLLVCGDLCRDLGDVAAAREAYRTLAIADPSKAALAQSRMGDLFIAFAERSTAAALQRDDAHFAAAGGPAKAIATYADLVARFPDDPTFREELGAIHEQLGNATAAALAYTQAMVGYLGSDDVARAVELAPKLLAVPSSDGASYELAARAFERAGHKTQTQSALDRALHAYHEQHAASDVERVCRHLAEIADDPLPHRRELARLLKESGDTAGAAEQLLEAAEQLITWSRGTDAGELLGEAAALAPDDEMTAARIAILQARADDVQRLVDDIARGDLLVSKQQYERAAEAYRRALEDNPAHAGAAYRLACLLMDHLHDDETAEKLLQTASELRPDHAATRYRLALVKAARGQVVEAVELLIALARFDEANADFIEQLAERLEKDAESGDVAAKYRLGIGYRELGRVDEALVILQSIQREPDYVVLCHNAIGLCLRRQGLDTAAAKRFTKAIETPGYPEAQYHEALYNLGELYLAKNTPESLALALASFEELYASDCTFKDVGDRIKSVKARMGTVDRPKVKRLPTRTADL